MTDKDGVPAGGVTGGTPEAERPGAGPLVNTNSYEKLKVSASHEWIDFFLQQGLSLIPLKENEKEPSIKWKKYAEERMPREELLAKLERDYSENYGIVCGEVSNNLLVVDIDSAEIVELLRLGYAIERTLTVKTAKGYHIYFFIKQEHIKQLNTFIGEKGSRTLYYPPKETAGNKAKEEIRFQWEGHQVVGPGSIHPSGIKYEHLSNSPKKIATLKGIGLLEEIERRWQIYRELVPAGEDVVKEPLLDFIRRYVTPENLEDHGDYIQMRCPFHQGTSPNAFTIYKADNHWYDFSEEIGGRHVEFYARLKNITKDQARRELNIKAGRVRKEEKESLISDVLQELGQYRFIALEDTEHVYCYNNGVYEHGEPVIKAAVERFLTDDTTAYYVNEIIGHIIRRNYIKRAEINKDRTRIPLKNGLFNLETFTLEPFSEAAIYTYRIPINYDAAAICPAIETWIKGIVEQDSLEMLQEFLGYCFEPSFPLHVTMWWYGTGRNGKGALFRLLQKAIGIDNTSAIPLEQLDSRYRFALMRLYMRFINVCSEPKTKYALTTEIFKKITGGDQIDGEIKGRQETIPFTSFAKFIIMGNAYPNIEDDTLAFWERIRIVKFPNAYTGDTDIKNIELKKIEEDGGEDKALAGFFNWCIAGLKRLKGRGYNLTESRSSEAVKIEFQKVSNSIKAFITEYVKLKADEKFIQSELYEIYKAYCVYQELTIQPKGEFTKKIGELRGVRLDSGECERMLGLAGKSNTRIWRGLKIEDASLANLANLADINLIKEVREEIQKRIGDLYQGTTPPKTPNLPNLTILPTSNNVCDHCGKDTVTSLHNGEQLCPECLTDVELEELEEEAGQ